MSGIDYIVIVVFSLLILTIALSFSKTSGRDMKSFFAAGGALPWWISSLSLFMGFVSAGTFVVWGSIAYSSGFVAVSIQWTMSVAGFLTGFFVAPRWHKTRSLTAAEYISDRLGIRVQKVYSYLYLSIMVFMTGVYLYSVSRIVEVSTGLPLHFAIALLGCLVLIYTTMGGLWAVVVTDTLQFVILTAAAIIVVPLSLEHAGGLDSFLRMVPDSGFLGLTNQDYTWNFLLGFGLYNFFYLSGQWGFVQRYTSVGTSQEAKKVGWLFGGLYIISPIIWMLPPMVYRVLNPELTGLQDEGAYLMMCKEVLPSGMLGLMVISLVFATNSSVQGVLNISAGVITNDLYRTKFPQSSEKRLMVVAKLASIFFGLVTILIAMLVPYMGGAKEVVLSVAALTGAPLYLPLVWSVFSSKQKGRIVLFVTLLSLFITLLFKFLVPPFFEFNLSRGGEMLFGVLVPAVLMLISEIYIRCKGVDEMAYLRFMKIVDQKLLAEKDAVVVEVSDDDNAQGVKMVAFGIMAVGVIIGVLGLMATVGKPYLLGMALVLVGVGIRVFVVSRK